MPAAGFLRPSTLTPEENDAYAPRRVNPYSAQRAIFTGGTMGPLPQIIYNAGRVGLARASDAPRLAPDEANARYGIDGHLSFDKPVTESEAAIRQTAKRDELWRQDMISRGDVAPLTSFGLAVGGSFFDPASLALNFIPIVGEAKIASTLGLGVEAAQASRLAAFGAHAARGAYAGLGGGLLSEGVSYGLGHGVLGQDYTLNDAVAGVTAGAILGAGAGGALGAAGWRGPAAGAKGAAADLIRAEAAAAGVDADTAVRIAQIESGLNPEAKNPSSSAAGLFQFTDHTWDGLGGGDKFDATLNARRGIDLQRKNMASLRTALGREPTPEEVYLAHQQGAGGAIALLRDPNRDAVEALMTTGASRKTALAAIKLNGATEGVTAGEFADLWARRFRGSAQAAPLGERLPMAADFDPLPRSVAMLDETARHGGLARAVADLADGRPVEVGELLDMEAQRGGGPRPELDENPDNFGLAIPAKVFDTTTATTLRGEEIPAHYALVEARDLITSHDGAGVRRPDYPEAMQAEDTGRAARQDRQAKLETAFDPARLIDGQAAESGPPLVAPDGVVESGNGRTAMLARNAAEASPAYAAYRAELEARGYDTAQMDAPVLVRVRSEPMEGAQRVRLARQMEADSGLPPRPEATPSVKEPPAALAAYDSGPTFRRSADADGVALAAAATDAPSAKLLETEAGGDADMALLKEDVARLEALHGPDEPSTNPKTATKAIAAAAECLMETA